jgi:hypothetical protein
VVVDPVVAVTPTEYHLSCPVYQIEFTSRAQRRLA